MLLPHCLLVANLLFCLIMEIFKSRNLVRPACPLSCFSEPVPQPIIYAECINKTTAVKCEVKQATKNQTFTMEVVYDKITKKSNLTKMEFTTTHSGRFRCTVKNKVSEKTTEKQVKCSGRKSIFTTICWFDLEGLM